MKIGIIGATRGIGLELTKQALADGHKVTALVRISSSMPIAHSNLTLVGGSAENAESIEKIVEGQDVICDCLGTAQVSKKITLFSLCAENLVKFLKPEQLLIAITGIGSGDSKGHGGFLYDKIILPLFLRRIYDDKNLQENIIKTKINRWIIIRPGFLNNGSLTEHYRILTDLHGINGGKISRADVAHFILSQVKAPQFIGQTPMLIQ